MPITMQSFESIALEDPERNWELYRGQLREKPATSVSHNRTMARLAHQLSTQLDIQNYEVRSNTGRLRYGDEIYFVPDIYVISVELVAQSNAVLTESLEVIADPLPFVAEVWSPSTGNYDIEQKIPEYQRRGDREVWRIHPWERSVRRWVLQAEGTYQESNHLGGIIEPVALPAVRIDLDALFTFG